MLLFTGAIDQTVNPANTLRLVDALIKADKDFDMFVLPKCTHGFFGESESFFEHKMWRHFARLLLHDNSADCDIDLNKDMIKDFLVPNQLLIEEEKQRHKEFVTDENTDEQAAPPVPLNKRKVLIIEDDNDVREFLKEEISHYFEVVAEADGISGFERAQTYDADLIICDVLMPGMTGFEVTKKLKNEFATSHIPIILLTALNMEEKYLEGIESGADAYITKPFSISLLLARISKLIEQRDKLREKFSNEPGMVHAAICTNNKDSKFLAKLNEMLNEHMVETEFSVDDYANLMGLGRTVFYKKVRGVTGYSPNEYLRVIRLKKAAELLLTEDLTVSEISYKVGINDPYYFSKCFKNQFGIAPSVYQKNGGKAPASNDTAENTEQASEEKEEENETDV